MKYLVLLLFVGCASYTPQLKKDINYQRDIRMEVSYARDGKWLGPLDINGMGVMYNSSHYKIKVFPTGKADMITITSCHREIKTPAPKKSGWYKGGYEFVIPVIQTVDDDELCSFDIGIYEKKKGRHAWGMIAMENTKKFSMPALTKCNGRVKRYDGTSVCQAKVGLIQEYIFDRKVSYAKVKGCEIYNLNTADKYSDKWKFIMPSGECEVFFVDIKNPMKKVHQAFLFGYDTIAIRGIE